MAIDIQERDRLEDFISFWRRNAETDVVFAKDINGALLRSFKVLGLGQTAVIDRTGSSVYNGAPLGYDELKGIIEEII